MNDGQLLLAYHGCDVTTRDDLVAGRTQPRSSQNKYDWLGPGFYLFEGDPERAKAFAETAQQQPARRLTAQPIANAAVVGCALSVQRCLDMTTRLGLVEFAAALEVFTVGFPKHQRMPVNKPIGPSDSDVLLRHLDNAVLTLIQRQRDADAGEIFYQAVRGAFRQGAPLAENSGFHRDSHIQIALRDPRCVRGWFLVPGDKLLTDAEYQEAKNAFTRARDGYKKKRVKLLNSA